VYSVSRFSISLSRVRAIILAFSLTSVVLVSAFKLLYRSSFLEAFTTFSIRLWLRRRWNREETLSLFSSDCHRFSLNRLHTHSQVLLCKEERGSGRVNQANRLDHAGHFQKLCSWKLIQFSEHLGVYLIFYIIVFIIARQLFNLFIPF